LDRKVKDALGNVLQEGDIVAHVATWSGSVHITKNKIVEFTPCKVRVCACGTFSRMLVSNSRLIKLEVSNV